MRGARPRQSVRRLSAGLLLVLLTLALARADEPASISSDLAALGIPVTAGAAPGYVDDHACASCHTDVARTYKRKGMARAFFRPRPETDIEDFSAPPFYHAASRQSFQIVRDGERLVFRRWQTDEEARPVHVFETEVDWILGSGGHSRTYLYRAPGGEMFQLPLAWYSQTRKWGMAPGYDRPDHDGVLRQVRRECLFCHDAYPEVPAGSDAHNAPHLFPASLPEGLGCQRCHGPGAEHVWLASGGMVPAPEIRAAIFNPGRLPPKRRDEVCLGCHFQPSVILPGLRRFGRGDFSFRAGEPLDGYLVQVDVEEDGRRPDERFEINHHAWRLRQSRCYLESGGGVGCLSCHDPHRVLPAERMKARVKGVCLGCHTQVAAGHAAHAAKDDCASCHMPKRRTQDVVQVVMTDHRIQWGDQGPASPKRLAPLSERDPALTGVKILGGVQPGPLAEVYRASAAVRSGGGAEAVSYLERKLAEAKPAEPEPWFDLAQGQLRLGRFKDAEATLSGLLQRRPDDLLALEWLALARAAQGKIDEAIELTRRSLATGSNRVEAEYNLGRLLAAKGLNPEAEEHLRKAVSLRPNLAAGWFRLGEVQAAQGRKEEALASYRRALEIDPGHAGARKALMEDPG
jgi:predicted CXXCH cytochrome family protein